MAKGDHARMQQAVQQQTQQAQNSLNQTRGNINAFRGMVMPYYNQASSQAIPDYRGLMNQAQEFMKPGSTQQPQNRAGATASGGTDYSGMNQNNTDQYRPQDYEQALQAAAQITGKGGGVTDQDRNYWSQMWQKDPGYAWKRMLGWQAGGADVAKSGPYAGANSGAMMNSSTGNPFYDSIANSLGGYQNFAQTGGFSDQDLQNIRARANAPIRGVYSNAQANVDRNRRLAGSAGAPNATAAQAKMARDM